MKGFVGGIPIALLAVAAQAQFVERQEHGFPPPVSGGTAMGGPSGNDGDGGFVSPYSANLKTNTQVNEWNKDDHSIDLKHKDVYPPPHVHHSPATFGPPVYESPQVPGMGPFEKRGAPGGTAMGGPSGNDEGQTFDMPITGIFNTEVNDSNEDDHSIDVKKTHVHPPPVAAPAPHFNQFNPSPALGPDAFEKRFGPEEGGTAMGGPGGGSHHSHGPPHGYPHPHGGTAMGGPSGDDGGQTFSAPVTGHFNTKVNEFNKDDHSIDLKHKDEYLPPVAPPFHPYGAPFKRGWEPENGGTAMGGPSGDDGGQTFSAPITVDTNTDVNEHSEDNHGIHLKHKDVYEAPHVVPGRQYGGPGPVIFNGPQHGYAGPSSHGPPHPDFHGPPAFHGPPGPHGPHHPDVYAPHTGIYAPQTYAPQEDTDLNSIKQINNGPAAGGVGPFTRRSTDLPPAHLENAHFANHFENTVPPHPAFHGPPAEVHGPPAAVHHAPPHPEAFGPPHPHYYPPPRPQVYAPETGIYAPQTYAPEEEFDLDAIKQINNGPSAGAVGPFGRRAFAPSREAGGGGGTAMGGPSGDDEDGGFSAPTNVDVNTGVNEHNEDSHAIKGDFTHVHKPHEIPYYNEVPYGYESPAAPAEYPVSNSYEEPSAPAPPSPPMHSTEAPPTAEVPETYQSPPSPPAEEQHEAPPSDSFTPQEDYDPSPPAQEQHEAPPSDSFTPQEDSTPPREEHAQCSAQVHEVVRTVTKTQYKTAQATHVVYESAPAMRTSAMVPINSAMVPINSYQQSAEVDPKIMSSAAWASSAPAPSQVRSNAYNYASQRPMSHAASYSMIPVHVPMATPSSMGSMASMASMATPSGTHGLNMPTDVSAEQKASHSASASASASASHVMFTGAAPRVSGGLVSAAGAVMGVLAFIL